MTETTVNTTAPRQGRRWLRRISWVIGPLLILCVVAYFVATSSAFFKGVILPKVGKAMNSDVTVTGASISPFKSVILYDFKLQPKGKDALFTAKEIRLRYSLMAMVAGNIDVQEVYVGSPLVSLVYASDGTSNLDPIMKSLEETPPAEAKPEAKAEPLKINLQKLEVENGALRYTQAHDATHKDVSEIAPLNVTLANVQNGQTAKLTINSLVKVLMNPPAPDTNGTLEAKLDGAFEMALSADAKPASVQGAAKLQVGSVGGMFEDLAGITSDFTCNFSPAEVKEIALRLQKAGAELAKLQAHGPLSFEKQEGRLYVELVGLDRRALNIAGAPYGMDFGPTTIGSTNEIQMADAGKSISVAGQFLVNQLQVTQTNQTSPRMDLGASYQLTVNQAAQNLVLRSLNLSGTQNQVPFLTGGLSSPMTISWGDTKQAVGDSRFTFEIKDFDLGPWRAFAGDAVTAGRLQAALQVLSQKGGEELIISVSSRLANLVSGTGAEQMTLTSAALAGQTQITGFEKYSGNFSLTNLSMLDKKTKKPTPPLEAGLQFDMSFSTNGVLDIRSTSLTLTPTARAKNVVNLTGRIDLANSEAMTGNVALSADALDFTRYFDLFYDQSGEGGAGVGGAAEPEVEAEPMDLPITNFTANARVGVIYLRETVMSNVVTSVSINGSKVAVKPMGMALNGAPVSGSVLLDLGVPGFKYDVDFKAEGVPFAPLVNTFMPEYRDLMGGTISGQGSVSGIGTTGPNLQKHLAGSFDVATTNLNFALSNVKNPVLKTVVRVIAIVPELRADPNAALGSLAGAIFGGSSSKPGSWSDELSRSIIDVMQFKVSMGSGKVELAKAFLQSPAFQVDASGPIHLAAVMTNSTMNIPLNIAVARSLAEKINFVPAGTPTNAIYVALPNYVAMKGKLGEPSADINKKVLLGSALEQLGGKIPGVDSKTGSLIQGLGGLLSGRKPATAETNAPAGTNQPSLQPTNPPAGQVKTNPSSANDLLNQILRPKK